MLLRLYVRYTISILLMLLSAAVQAEQAGEPVAAKSSEPKPVANNEVAEKAEAADKFDIFEYQVEGNTVLPVGKVEEAVYPFLGEAKTVEDAEKARAALEKAFHAAGYLTVFVNIPEQEVNAGLVRLEVQEGQVERLKVVGAKYNSLGKIKARVGEFAEGHVPYFPNVQKQIAAVNATQDRVVAPVLRPSKTPGKVEVDLKVDDKLPFHGGIELNNRYSPNTTESRLSGSMRYDNLWQLDHSISVGFQVTPEDTDETKVLSATYVIPNDGDYWALYGVLSKSDVSAVGDVSVIGNGNIFGMRFIHPLPGVESYNHSLTLGVDYKDFKETTELQGSDGFNTPIAYMPFYIGYDGTYTTSSSSTKLSLGVTLSVRGLGNDEQEFADKRFLARPNFSYLRTELKHTQRFYKNWELIAAVAGQVTGDSLISNEQFSIGGLDTVRGYLESNSLGDHGVNANLELRTPPLQKYVSDKISNLYALAFYDYGHARVRDPLPTQTSSFNLASAGLGLHLKGYHGLFAEVDYAKALRDAGQIEDGDDRWHVRIGYDW